MAERFSGGCLCGVVQFAAEPKALEMSVCHCSVGGRWASGVFMFVDCGNTVALENDGALGVYESSAHGERVFCRKCGSAPFWRMRDGSRVNVAVRAFDDPSVFSLTTEIFVDDKPDNYALTNRTRKMTGAGRVLRSMHRRVFGDDRGPGAQFHHRFRSAISGG